MSEVPPSQIPGQAIEFAMGFFNRLSGAERNLMLKVIRSSQGGFMASDDSSVLAVFFFDQDTRRRVDRYREKGWHPFPGLIVSEEQRTSGGLSVAFPVTGKCQYFSSNYTSNTFAFSVGPNGSFTIVDHHHEIVHPSEGETLSYTVPLAFILGHEEGEQWPALEVRLNELLEHTFEIWKKA